MKISRTLVFPLLFLFIFLIVSCVKQGKGVGLTDQIPPAPTIPTLAPTPEPVSTLIFENTPGSTEGIAPVAVPDPTQIPTLAYTVFEERVFTDNAQLTFSRYCPHGYKDTTDGLYVNVAKRGGSDHCLFYPKDGWIPVNGCDNSEMCTYGYYQINHIELQAIIHSSSPYEFSWVSPITPAIGLVFTCEPNRGIPNRGLWMAIGTGAIWTHDSVKTWDGSIDVKPGQVISLSIDIDYEKNKVFYNASNGIRSVSGSDELCSNPGAFGFGVWAKGTSNEMYDRIETTINYFKAYGLLNPKYSIVPGE